MIQRSVGRPILEIQNPKLEIRISKCAGWDNKRVELSRQLCSLEE